MEDIRAQIQLNAIQKKKEQKLQSRTSSAGKQLRANVDHLGPKDYVTGKSTFRNTHGNIHPKLPDQQNITPGFYFFPKKETPVGGFIGEKHETLHKQRIPGPGTYENKRQIFNLSRSLPFSQSEVKQPRQTAGPSDYNPNLERSVLGGNIGNKMAAPAKKATPGPGAYEAKQREVNPSTIAVRRDAPVNQGPGPADYQAPAVWEAKGGMMPQSDRDNARPEVNDIPMIAAGSTLTSKGGAIYDKREAAIEPTPGPYNVRPQPTAAGAYIGDRHADPHQDRKPGPGAYDQSREGIFDAKVQPFSQSEVKPLKITAGPGDYQISRQKSGELLIHERFPKAQKEVTPAPGEYAGQSTLLNKQQTIAVRQDIIFQDAPGPSDYIKQKKW
uniref:SHIPPO 1-like protein n=1 Tax=Spironucleus salmonicida TaxID=348837 RepID=V6M3F2_9EUKA|eukprot:EST47814.1 SHIPPO 1-like protein [Spironucleus salmonicida]